MSKLTLYISSGSPPARAVQMFIKYLELDAEVIALNFLQKENLTPFYLKLNPTHQVPVLVDGDFVLTESRAILQYLANSRKPGSDIYPTEPKARARVDQRLNFDNELFVRNSAVIRPILYGVVKQVPQLARDRVHESLLIIEKFLENSKWIAADHLTIADFSALTTITLIAECGYNLSQHENISRWYKQGQALPGFEENRQGMKGLVVRLQSLAEGSLF